MLENSYGCDCAGCGCQTGPPTPEPTVAASCPSTCYGATCAYWESVGYSCSTLENSYGCDCAGCGCQTAHPTPEPTVACKQTSQAVPIDMVFIVDGSGSVGASGFQDSKDFVNDVVAQFNIGSGSTDTRVGVVQYSSSGSSITIATLAVGTSVSTITSAVDSMYFQNGGTYTGQAITYAQDSVLDSARATAQKLMIVLTDGQSADTPGTTADAARAAGITVFAVGVSSGSDSDYSELESIGGSAANVFSVGALSELSSIVGTIAAAVCDLTDATSCPNSCYGTTCSYWEGAGYSCSALEDSYGCDCGGCDC